ncbi:MAG TPA: cupredoxin domain-containing protein [Candidatus Limnocylindrales bacterium]
MAADRTRGIVAIGIGLIAAGAVVAGLVASAGAASDPSTVEIRIHFSRFQPSTITVPAGRPITFVLVNEDPIDHEWIVGDAALHARHRTGTEPYHASRPTEVSIDALTERRTVVTFAQPGTYQFICHLPGHEAYGMVGTVTVTR